MTPSFADAAGDVSRRRNRAFRVAATRLKKLYKTTGQYYGGSDFITGQEFIKAGSE